MSVYPCPQGHDSIDADYCSQCGTKIVVTPPVPAAKDCPKCQATHLGGDFCEACGYNFVSGKLATEPSAVVANWVLEIDIDCTKDPESATPPQTLDLPPGSYLIGRTSQARAIHPQVSLEHDDAVSHRHAIIEIVADGRAILRDIGSANGTSLNGHEIPIIRDVPLQSGDVITLGHCTKLTISYHN
jgi:hypothetical protein